MDQIRMAVLKELPRFLHTHPDVLDFLARTTGHPRLRRRPRPSPDAPGVSVDPRRPSLLDGGAAAALTFDD